MWPLGAQPEPPGWQPPGPCPLPHPFPPHRPLWKREASGSPCSQEGRPVWGVCTRVREERWLSGGWNEHFRGERFQRQQWMAQWMLSRPCPHPVTFPFPGRQTAVPATGPPPHSQAGGQCQGDARSSLTQGQWQLGDNHSTLSPSVEQLGGVVYTVSGGAHGG
uniref:Uncharacterized protein n=1 Tax=Myotis myotis TaxID=51298 RepID=A0A7J7ZWZ1_MYOMY|nr:hypothetical protein mMyoMyo1_009683 [Myotis myotis]